ncbi:MULTISPECIES: hypothetical protein [Xanthomonas translucens group]|uniref:hypothetical protein n=1 Tax=Xanthomonas translucens group TaxID=3390202 RepID=UPI000579720E|nr:hypothetical protein [Xanthomonas translucens]UKE46530.1 hypothetical protein KHA79_15780 [Xanthomonas translucens pv. cerealis]UKE68870.1 hypothetical protein K8O61_15635 [Xanthomonas translucens pv. pistacia]
MSSRLARLRCCLCLFAGTLVFSGCARSEGAKPAAHGLPVKVDTTCRSDADCMIKDVGNCCGAMPACVNRDSPTDPHGVMAQCQASGLMSVCGSPAISGCQCVAGHCSAKGVQADTLRDPQPAEPVR